MTDAAATPDTTRRLGRRRAWLSAAMIAGFVVLLEVVLRLSWAPDERVRLKQLDDVLSGSSRHQAISLFESDPELFWRLAPDRKVAPGDGPLFGRVSNAQGWRAEGEIGPKQSGEVRILFLGDSCTFGYMLFARQTFVALTEKALHQRFPGRKFTCINGGVPGYTAFQCWRRLETAGFDLQPDLVVMQFGWNGRDVWDGRSDLEHYRAFQDSRPPGVLAHSRLCQLVWRTLYWPGPGEDGRARLAPSELRKLMERMGESCDKRGVALLFLVTGCRQNIQHGALTAAQGEQMEFGYKRRFGGQPAVVEGVSALKQLVEKERRPVDSLLFDDAHPTEAYNEVLAQGLVSRIGPWVAGR